MRVSQAACQQSWDSMVGEVATSPHLSHRGVGAFFGIADPDRVAISLRAKRPDDGACSDTVHAGMGPAHGFKRDGTRAAMPLAAVPC